MNFLFDTSFIIDALRQDKKAREVLSKFENSRDHLFIPSIIGFELFSGQSLKDSIQNKNIREFLSHFKIVDLSWNISKVAGEIFRDNIKDLEVPDYIVAATAEELGAQVVTLNVKHFQKIPGLSIYSIRP